MSEASRRFVVLDDDPTGIQTVHGCLLLTRWDCAAIERALADGCPFFYVLTNSRALAPAEARRVVREIVENVLAANAASGHELVFLSRSDSTLRSHFPIEIDQITDVLGARMGVEADATFLVPAFMEGGRLTIDATHYVAEGASRTPAAETEFARDSVFGYRHSDLREYIEEKTAGRVAAADVAHVGLDALRGDDPTRLGRRLAALRGNRYVVVDAETYDDLDRFTESLRQAMDGGKRFLFQCAASLVRSLTHTPPQPLLDGRIAAGDGPGVFIVGSHVQKTTRQLEALLVAEGIDGVEVDVGAVLDAPEAVRGAVTARMADIARAGWTAAVYTSRQELTFDSKARRQAAGQRIARFLAGLVSDLPFAPSYILAKGGITSHVVMADGLHLQTVRVLGQVAPGVPAVMLPDDHRFARTPYVIFPGNVGDDAALRSVFERLTKGRYANNSGDSGAKHEHPSAR